MDFNGLLNGFSQMDPSMLSSLTNGCGGGNNNFLWIIIAILFLSGNGNGNRNNGNCCEPQCCCCRRHHRKHDNCCDNCCNNCGDPCCNSGNNGFLGIGDGNNSILWVIIFIIFFCGRNRRCDPCSTSNILNVDGGVA